MNTKNIDKHSDEEIVRHVREGNKEGVEVLVQRYRPYILRIVKRMAEVEAEDLTQDIMIKVLLAIKSFEQRSSLSTWLYRITVNHVLQYKRQMKHQTISAFSTALEVNESSAEKIEEPASGDAVYLGMLLCLDENQRTAVTLSDIFKLDHNQASEVLKINPAAFRKRLSRAREDLKSWLNGECSLAMTKGSCRCKRKAQQFMENGWVNKETQKFEQERIQQAMDTLVSLQMN